MYNTRNSLKKQPGLMYINIIVFLFLVCYV